MRKVAFWLAVGCVTALTVAFSLRSRQVGIRSAGEIQRLRPCLVEVERLRTDNQRLRATIAEAKRGEAEAARALNDELDRARREVTELEARAAETRRQRNAKSHAAETNRDPEHGPTRPEYFRNLGFGSPVSAFQTIVSAAASGDTATLVRGLAVNGKAREDAIAVAGRLPPLTQSQFSPETLAAIALGGEFSKNEPVAIVGQTFTDPSHAQVKITAGGHTAELPMVLGAPGWQLVVPAAAVAALERRMADIPPAQPPGK